MSTYNCRLFFPGDIELNEEGITFEKALTSIEKIDWEMAFKTFAAIVDNTTERTTSGLPFFSLIVQDTKRGLHFSVARNSQLENKVLAYFMVPTEKTSFFGLIKKPTLKSTGGLLQKKEDIDHLLALLGKRNYEELEKVMSTLSA